MLKIQYFAFELMQADLPGVNQYLEARGLPLIWSVPSPLFGCHG